MKNEKTSKATLAPVVFVSPEALKEVKAQRNPNDLIIMNAQTDLCGRKLALIPVSEIDTEMTY